MLWGPLNHELGLMGVRVFVFGENVEDITRGVVCVTGFEVCSINECGCRSKWRCVGVVSFHAKGV
jgi:hypothetical protein